MLSIFLTYIIGPAITGILGVLIEKHAPKILRKVKIGNGASEELLKIVDKATDKNVDLLDFAKKEGLKIAAKQIEKYLDIGK